jgi:hypothetical protein
MEWISESMPNLKLGCPTRSKEKKKRDFFQCLSFLQLAGLENKKIGTFLQLWTFFDLYFFWKSCLFLKTEMDNPPSNFRENTMQCISIDWYPETSTFTLYTAVNTTGSLQKATNWSGIKNGRSSKEIRLSWYHCKDKKHFQVHVKFEGGVSIPATRKMTSKKVRLFLRAVQTDQRDICFCDPLTRVWNGGVWNTMIFSETFRCPVVNFCDELPSFS